MAGQGATGKRFIPGTVDLTIRYAAVTERGAMTSGELLATHRLAPAGSIHH
jgi:hypothetical protein